jgi:hypothetical protein
VQLFWGNISKIPSKKEGTPKVHMPETHVLRGLPLQVFKRVGPYREDPVEHQHQLRKKSMQLVVNIADYEKKLNLINSRDHAKVCNSEIVQSIVNNYPLRAQSDATIGKRKRTADQEKDVKEIKLTEIFNNVIAKIPT